VIYEWHTLPIIENTNPAGSPMAGVVRSVDVSSLGEHVGLVNVVMGETEALCLVAR
jgi:hypothetical protein